MAETTLAGCLACDLVAGVRPLPSGVIHSWLVEHCGGPLGVGALIVKPERHVIAIADLDPAETTTMGWLLHRTSQVITELCEPDQQPVRRADLQRFGAQGPRLQVAMFENDPASEPGEVERFADRAREIW